VAWRKQRGGGTLCGMRASEVSDRDEQGGGRAVGVETKVVSKISLGLFCKMTTAIGNLGQRAY
jgi:hypothetical protein